MPDIRYVCVSDMHLGEEDSILTNLKTASTDTDPTKPSPVLESLVECLRALIEKNEDRNTKPTLILGGDILELALTTTNQAAMAFERFIELAMPQGGELFGEIFYIPGNHDHHLWEVARETQYVDYIRNLDPGAYLNLPWHASSMFVESGPHVPAYFLTRLIGRHPHLENQVVAAAYPNFGLLSQDGQKCVIYHHGHFIDPMYQLMSTLKTLILMDHEMPKQVWDIEAENFAWIDFFWSVLGRSGDVGEGVESVYEKLGDPKQLRKMLDNLAENLADQYDLPGWDRMTERILKSLLHHMANKAGGTERKHTARSLSEDAEKGLWQYMNGPLRKQILGERKGNMPADVTFIFGHTHKPFQEDMNFKGFPKWVNVYNTGGWVVESVDPEPIHGGAIVLIDTDLNTTSVRMYNEAVSPADYVVKVEQARHTGEPDNPFYTRILEMIDPGKEPWKTFSEIVARTVRIRAQHLRARINEAI